MQWPIWEKNLKKSICMHVYNLFLQCNSFPSGSDGRESASQYRRHSFDPWVGKIPCRREWQPTLVLLPGEFHGQRSLVGYSPWGYNESETAELLALSLSLFDFIIDSLYCITETNRTLQINIL